MSDAPKMTYDVTARFDDGLFKIVDNEWVKIGPGNGPKRVDLRSAYGDGIALTTIAHPSPKGWRRVWSWLRTRRDISSKAIENV